VGGGGGGARAPASAAAARRSWLGFEPSPARGGRPSASPPPAPAARGGLAGSIIIAVSALCGPPSGSRLRLRQPASAPAAVRRPASPSGGRPFGWVSGGGGARGPRGPRPRTPPLPPIPSPFPPFSLSLPPAGTSRASCPHRRLHAAPSGRRLRLAAGSAGSAGAARAHGSASRHSRASRLSLSPCTLAPARSLPASAPPAARGEHPGPPQAPLPRQPAATQRRVGQARCCGAAWVRPPPSPESTVRASFPARGPWRG
jgi:hypothetical protein